MVLECPSIVGEDGAGTWSGQIIVVVAGLGHCCQLGSRGMEGNSGVSSGSGAGAAHN